MIHPHPLSPPTLEFQLALWVRGPHAVRQQHSVRREEAPGGELYALHEHAQLCLSSEVNLALGVPAGTYAPEPGELNELATGIGQKLGLDVSTAQVGKVTLHSFATRAALKRQAALEGDQQTEAELALLPQAVREAAATSGRSDQLRGGPLAEQLGDVARAIHRRADEHGSVGPLSLQVLRACGHVSTDEQGLEVHAPDGTEVARLLKAARERTAARPSVTSFGQISHQIMAEAIAHAEPAVRQTMRATLDRVESVFGAALTPEERRQLRSGIFTVRLGPDGAWLGPVPLQGPLSAEADRLRSWLIEGMAAVSWNQLRGAAELVMPGPELSADRVTWLATRLNPLLRGLHPKMIKLDYAEPPLRRERNLRERLLPQHSRRRIRTLDDLGQLDADYSARYRGLLAHLGPQHAELVASMSTGSGLISQDISGWAHLLTRCAQAGRALGTLKTAAALARDSFMLHAATRQEVRASQDPGLRARLRQSVLGQSYGLLRGLERSDYDLQRLHDELIGISAQLESPDTGAQAIARRGAQRIERREARRARSQREHQGSDPAQVRHHDQGELSVTLEGQSSTLKWTFLDETQLRRVAAAMNNCAAGYGWWISERSGLVLIGPNVPEDLSAPHTLHLAQVQLNGDQWDVLQISSGSNLTRGETPAVRAALIAALNRPRPQASHPLSPGFPMPGPLMSGPLSPGSLSPGSLNHDPQATRTSSAGGR